MDRGAWQGTVHRVAIHGIRRVEHDWATKHSRANWTSGVPGGASGKEPDCQCRRQERRGLTPVSGRSPGGGHDNPLQYSCLQNPMDREAWQGTVHSVAKSRTWQKDLGCTHIPINSTESWIFLVSSNIWLQLSKLMFQLSPTFLSWNQWERRLPLKLLRRDSTRSSSLPTWQPIFRVLNLTYTSHSWRVHLTFGLVKYWISKSTWVGREAADSEVEALSRTSDQHFILQLNMKFSLSLFFFPSLSFTPASAWEGKPSSVSPRPLIREVASEI